MEISGFIIDREMSRLCPVCLVCMVCGVCGKHTVSRCVRGSWFPSKLLLPGGSLVSSEFCFLRWSQLGTSGALDLGECVLVVCAYSVAGSVCI